MASSQTTPPQCEPGHSVRMGPRAGMFLHSLSARCHVVLNSSKPVAPDWKSLPIPNPSLESHLRDPKLLPSVASEGRRFITSYDPSNGLHIGTFLADDEGDIDRKIRLAADAQKSWKTTTFGERRRVIRSLNKWLVDNQDICARTACRDTGKTRTWHSVLQIYLSRV